VTADTLLILATDRVSADGLHPLLDDERFEVRYADSGSAEFASALPEAAGLIVRSATLVDAGMMDRAPALAAIGRAGVGVDNIDLAAAGQRGIGVFNAPGGNTIAAAEMTMAMILAVVRRVPEADRSLREGKWERASLKGVQLEGKTLGLLGAGRIGAEVAIRCLAFGMKAIAFDPYLPEERATEVGIELVALDEVIEQGDVISLHVPLNDETRGMVSSAELTRMKTGAFLVNVSRGGVIDEQALATALVEGSIAGAAIDVFESEPLADDSPLRSAPNLVMTPHLGASTIEAQVSVAVEVASALRDALTSDDMSGALNASQLSS
jgi:D-3-phosphoglycerate dehydrogenase